MLLACLLLLFLHVYKFGVRTAKMGIYKTHDVTKTLAIDPLAMAAKIDRDANKLDTEDDEVLEDQTHKVVDEGVEGVQVVI